MSNRPYFAAMFDTSPQPRWTISLAIAQIHELQQVLDGHWNLSLYGSTLWNLDGRDLDLHAVPKRPPQYLMPVEMAVTYIRERLGYSLEAELTASESGTLSVLLRNERRQLIDLCFAGANRREVERLQERDRMLRRLL